MGAASCKRWSNHCPICPITPMSLSFGAKHSFRCRRTTCSRWKPTRSVHRTAPCSREERRLGDKAPGGAPGSGEHTPELHSPLNILFPLFLFKKKKSTH